MIFTVILTNKHITNALLHQKQQSLPGNTFRKCWIVKFLEIDWKLIEGNLQ